MPARLILTATLPTTPSGLRVRVWRALKATGAGTLREAVYPLPEAAPTAPALWDLARTIVAAGADAHLLVVPARDEVQAQAFGALFDRSAARAALLQTIQAVRASLHAAAAAQLCAVEQQWQGLQGMDFFPGPHSQQVAQALAALRRAVALQLSPDEPAPIQAAIPARNVADFQGRTWATLGGPAGQIALMHQELVARRRCISEHRFLHPLTFCMVPPGPEAQQLATCIGWLMHRSWGGVVAGLAWRSAHAALSGGL